MKILIVFAILFATSALASAQTATITADDLKIIEGAKWTGSLTYLDYRSNKKTSIRSDLIVSRVANDPKKWTFAYEYPDEPKANGSSVVVLSDSGNLFADAKVVEKTRLGDGGLRVVTEKDGTDNDKKAVFRYTYLIALRSFSIKKEVRLDGTTDWFERNEYRWTR